MPAQASDFNFVGPEYVAPNPYQDRQHLVNWYCEVDQNKAAKGSSPSLNPQAAGAIGLLGTPGLIPVANISGQIFPTAGAWPLPSVITNRPVRGMWELHRSHRRSFESDWGCGRLLGERAAEQDD